MPIKDASACPLPHVLLLHMLYHLVVIYLHRPFYRAPSDTVPASADRCNEAADALLRLLTVRASAYCADGRFTMSCMASTTPL